MLPGHAIAAKTNDEVYAKLIVYHKVNRHVAFKAENVCLKVPVYGQILEESTEEGGGNTMAGKVGKLIREARMAADLTQEALAKKIKGVTADDISLAERGKKDFTQAVLKEIAKVTGVTQKSLIDAAKEDFAKAESAKADGSASKKNDSSSSKKNDSSSSKKSGSSSSKKGSSSSSKKSGSSSKKTGSSSSFSVSSEEKKLIQAYRDADEKIQSAVNLLLLGTQGLTSDSGKSGSTDMADMLGSLVGSFKQFLG